MAQVLECAGAMRSLILKFRLPRGAQIFSQLAVLERAGFGQLLELGSVGFQQPFFLEPRSGARPPRCHRPRVGCQLPERHSER